MISFILGAAIYLVGMKVFTLIYGDDEEQFRRWKEKRKKPAPAGGEGKND